MARSLGSPSRELLQQPTSAEDYFAEIPSNDQHDVGLQRTTSTGTIIVSELVHDQILAKRTASDAEQGKLSEELSLRSRLMLSRC